MKVETIQTIRIRHLHDNRVDEAIAKFCEKIAGLCEDLDVVRNGQRTEWKNEGV